MLFRLHLILVLFLAFPQPVQAALLDISCDDRTRLQDTLQNIRGAQRQGTGLRDPNTMLEVWVTPGSGDWVIVQNYANGTACIVAMGEYWQGVPAKPA